MSTWNSRVAKARALRGYRKIDFARALGVSAPTVQGWENKKIKELKGQNLDKICTLLAIRQEWLLHGTGAMDDAEASGQPSPATVAELPSRHQAVLALLDGVADSQIDALLAHLKETRRQNEQIYRELSARRGGAPEPPAPANPKVALAPFDHARPWNVGPPELRTRSGQRGDFGVVLGIDDSAPEISASARH